MLKLCGQTNKSNTVVINASIVVNDQKIGFFATLENKIRLYHPSQRCCLHIGSRGFESPFKITILIYNFTVIQSAYQLRTLHFERFVSCFFTAIDCLHKIELQTWLEISVPSRNLDNSRYLIRTSYNDQSPFQLPLYDMDTSLTIKIRILSISIQDT